MKEHMKTMGITVKRTIPASPAQVYREWLNPKSPCNPCSISIAYNFKPKRGGLFYFRTRKEGMEIAHYGQFLALSPGKKIQQTWISRYTKGIESNVTVTFKKQGQDTLVTVHHANLPDDSFGMSHEKGWNWLLGNLENQFTK